MKANRAVLFLYGNAGDDKDAVARAVSELVVGLRGRDVAAAVILPPWRNTSGRWSRRVLGALYLVIAFERALFYPNLGTLVTLDAPAGLRWVGFMASRIRNARHVAWVMDLYPLQAGERGCAGKLRRRTTFRALRQTDEIVTLGRCMRSRLEGLLKGSVPIEIIRLWQDESWLEPCEPRCGNRPGATLIYSGHAGVQHPLRALVDAVRDVGSNGVTLDIVGWGSEHERMRKLLAEQSTDEVRMRPLASRREALEGMQCADVHVAVLGESMTGTCVPSKAYAAMALGKPVLFLGAPDSEIALELTENGAGLVAPTGDRKAIREALLALTNGVQRESMGRAARSAFVRSHSVAVGVSHWQRFLERKG